MDWDTFQQGNYSTVGGDLQSDYASSVSPSWSLLSAEKVKVDIHDKYDIKWPLMSENPIQKYKRCYDYDIHITYL